MRDADAGAILDALNGGVVVLDDKERIIGWNRWMETASGQTGAQVQGKSLPEIFPNINLKRLPSAIKAALQTGAPTIITHSLNPSLLPLHTRLNRPLFHDITVSPVTGGSTSALPRIHN